MNLPKLDAVAVNANHLALASRIGNEGRVAQKASNRSSDLTLMFGNVQKDQTVIRVTELRIPKSRSRLKKVGRLSRWRTGRIFSSLVLILATSRPICRTAMCHSRSRQASISEMFSSRMSMRLENAFILEDFARQPHCLGNGFHRDLAAPGPDNLLPRRAVGN